MKNVLILLVILGFSSTTMAQESWWENLLSAVGLGDDTSEQVQGPNADALLESICCLIII